MLYSEKVFIYFSQSDLAGVAYFSQFFDIAHRALENYIRKSTLGWDYWFNNADLAAPIKSTHCDFTAPLVSGEEYEIQISLEKHSKSTVTFQFDFLDKSQSSCAKLSTTHIFISKGDRKKIAIPNLISDLLNI